jgi:hypothetical protein
MKPIIFILLFTLFLSSCSSLKKSINSDGRIILTESNLTLLDGKYERESVQLNKDSFHGNLYWNFFDRGYNRKRATDFFELTVIDNENILVSYIDGNESVKSRNMKGKIKDGYFEFKRKHLFIPMIFVNMYRDSKFRIGISNDNDLTTDYKQITFGTAFVLFPFYEKKEENNMIYKRIENEQIGQSGFSQQFGRINIGAGIGRGTNHWGWNASLMYDGYGLGYGRTSYGGEHAQILGNYSAYWKGGSFTLQNDFNFKVLGITIGGDGGDRWRTNAWELTVGDWSIGSYIYTNEPEGEIVVPNDLKENPEKYINYDGVNMAGKKNKHGNGAWKNGIVYTSPLWLGYRAGNSVSRIGLDSPWVQDKTQNWVHRNGFFYLPFGHQNYYNTYSIDYPHSYFYSGYYNPFSLY